MSKITITPVMKNEITPKKKPVEVPEPSAHIAKNVSRAIFILVFYRANISP
jgi:hypothetical protein